MYESTRRNGRGALNMYASKRPKDEASLILIDDFESENVEITGPSRRSKRMQFDVKINPTLAKREVKIENGGGTSSIVVVDDDFVIQMPKGELVNEKKETIGKDKIRKGKIKGVVHEVPSISTRSSPKSLTEGINYLSDEQKDCVKQMGFGRMLSFSVDGIPGILGYYVVDHLDTKRMCIDTEKASIQITKEAIHTLIGVPIGGSLLIKNSESKENRNVSKFWKDAYGKSEISPQDIVRRLKTYTQADWLFRVDFVMLFLAIMIDCQRNGNCRLSYLPYFQKGRDISKVDWCSIIYSAIHDCKDEWVRDDAKSVFTGPLTILLLLYLDSTTCNGIQFEKRNYAMAEWNMERMKIRQKMEIEGG